MRHHGLGQFQAETGKEGGRERRAHHAAREGGAGKVPVGDEGVVAACV